MFGCARTKRFHQDRFGATTHGKIANYVLRSFLHRIIEINMVVHQLKVHYITFFHGIKLKITEIR